MDLRRRRRRGADADERVGALLARRDVFADRYPVVPPWVAVGLPRHAGQRYALWRRDPRDRQLHAVRVVQPYYAVPLPPALLTAREQIARRVNERAVAFAGRMLNVRGADGTPLRATSLAAGFTAADAEFFGAPARVDVRVLRDGARVGRHVNYQGGGGADDAEAREHALVVVCMRALNRALNRAMVRYAGIDDAPNVAHWEDLAAREQAREVWPSLSQRAFWSAAAWTRALALTSANGEWTRHWERAQRDVRDAAVAAQVA